jgi:hypothetical protein
MMAGGDGSEVEGQRAVVVVVVCCKECTDQLRYYGWVTQENPSQLALKKLHRKAQLSVHLHLQGTSLHPTPVLSPLQPQDPEMRI